MAQVRGRLSSLDLLPDEAQDDLVWAMAQLNERRRTQADILFELNDRLAVKGIDPISPSAFNRKAVRLAKRTQRLDERRHVYAGIAEKLTPDKIAEDDLILGEFIKTLIDELLDDATGTKAALDLARAYQAVVGAQGKSTRNRQDAEAARERANRKLAETIDAATAELGIDGTRAAELRRKVLGARPPAGS